MIVGGNTKVVYRLMKLIHPHLDPSDQQQLKIIHYRPLSELDSLIASFRKNYDRLEYAIATSILEELRSIKSVEASLKAQPVLWDAHVRKERKFESFTDELRSMGKSLVLFGGFMGENESLLWDYAHRLQAASVKTAIVGQSLDDSFPFDIAVEDTFAGLNALLEYDKSYFETTSRYH